jgi:hypothetical protein
MNIIKLQMLASLLLILSVFSDTNAQWVLMANGFNNPDVLSLTAYDNKIFAGTFNNGVYISTDYGENWAQDGLAQERVIALTTSGNSVCAGLSLFGIYKTTDEGVNWTQASFQQGSVGGFWTNADTILAGIWQDPVVYTGVLMSADNGSNWFYGNLDGLAVRAVTGSGNYIFGGVVGDSDGVYRSTDYGASWQQSLSNVDVWSLAANGSNIYAGTSNNYDGLFISTNYGDNWTQTSLDSVNVLSISLYGNNIIAGTGNGTGVFISTDNGASFLPWNEGMGTDPVRALCISNNYIFAGTRYTGVYRRSLDELLPVELVSFHAVIESGCKVKLDWKTETEKNNLGFEIERKDINLHSSTGNQWEKIGFVAGFGTTSESRSYSFTDNKITTGNYSYRLKQIDFDGSYKYSDEVEVTLNLPVIFSLQQNYPNPFNPATQIRYSIPKDGFVSLKVYNTLGQQVRELVNGIIKAGNHEVLFDASGLASGIYLYQLNAGSHIQTQKMILLK